MKGLKKALAVVLCMLLMLTPLATVAETVTVHAAQDVKTVKVKTDKKTGKRYGYDENNQKVTMTWGVTSSGFRYYFGKNGAAYQADKDTVGKYGILIKKIDKVYEKETLLEREEVEKKEIEAEIGIGEGR